MGEYTPGQWEVVYEEEDYFDKNTGPYGYKKVGLKIDDRIIWLDTNIYPSASKEADKRFKQWEAIAFMMAAAPELMKELKDHCNSCDAGHGEMKVVPDCVSCPTRKALDKAEGRDN